MALPSTYTVQIKWCPSKILSMKGQNDRGITYYSLVIVQAAGAEIMSPLYFLSALFSVYFPAFKFPTEH